MVAEYAKLFSNKPRNGNPGMWDWGAAKFFGRRPLQVYDCPAVLPACFCTFGGLMCCEEGAFLVCSLGLFWSNRRERLFRLERAQTHRPLDSSPGSACFFHLSK